MRTRIWLPCLLLVVICGLLIFWRGPANRAEQTVIESIAKPTNNQAGSIRTQNVKTSTTGQSQATAILPTKSAGTTSATNEANVAYQKLLSTWQAPIDFYGKVLDENSNVVAGAQVSFHWVETPDAGGNRDSQTSSDANGLFELHSAHGPSLAVVVAKDGYYSSIEKDHPPFKYGPFSMGGFSPDPYNPVVFHLHTKGKGASLIQTSFPSGIGQIAQLRHDGTPIEISLMDGQRVAPGTGQLKLELRRDISRPNAKTFDWSFQISVPSGGLVKTEDEFSFEAPETGYQPSVEVDMPATNMNWTEDFTSQFYVQLPGEKYAKINLYLSAYNGAFTVKSSINPSGSRDLEPAN